MYYFWLGKDVEEFHYEEYVEGVSARMLAYMEKWSGDFS